MSSISDNRIRDAAGAARPVEALLCGLTAPLRLCLVTRGVTAASAVVATVVTVENDGREPGVICTNTNGDCSTGGSIAIMVSDGIIVDKFVSISTFSGSFSIELIRIAGLSASALTDPVFTSGRSQFNANSSNNSALPTKPKYFSRGMVALRDIEANKNMATSEPVRKDLLEVQRTVPSQLASQRKHRKSG
jgi:hypothetical protein